MNQHLNLEAAQAAFFASGGRIVVLEGFEYVPLPARKEPPRSRRRRRIVKDNSRQEAYAAKVAQVQEAAQRMTCQEAAEHFGIPYTTLRSMGKREGFSFVWESKRRKRERLNAEVDAGLAEKARQCMAAGMSRNMAGKELGVSSTKFLRIITQFNIDYPKAAPAFRKPMGRKP